jgi:hypothetical protein
MSDGRLNLFGRSFTLVQRKDYVADVSTIAGARPYFWMPTRV